MEALSDTFGARRALSDLDGDRDAAVEVSWTFGDEGTVLLGCHQPGHYAAGMTGRITVEG